MASTPGSEKAQGLLDVLIRAGMIVVLAVICYRVFYPFLNLLLWSMILAVTLYPLQLRLKRKIGIKDGRVATLIVLVAIAILIVPIYLLSTSIAASVQDTLETVRSGRYHVPPPPPAVDAWPMVHDYWEQASTDLTGLTQRFAPQLRAISVAFVQKLAELGAGLLMFIFALILAGIFMAYGESGHQSAVRAASRVFGHGRGPHISELCTATIRAVALGVIGIAFIQMLLVGVGFVVMGVPAAGVLALIVLLLGIMQVPATVITVPVIAFVLATHGVGPGTIAFSIYVFLAGLVDNVLKPLLLGRGVDVPMPVVLIGALGGMVTGGIIGLFIGPVILAIGYELFWQWVSQQEPKPVSEPTSAPNSSEPGSPQAGSA